MLAFSPLATKPCAATDGTGWSFSLRNELQHHDRSTVTNAVTRGLDDLRVSAVAVSELRCHFVEQLLNHGLRPFGHEVLVLVNEPAVLHQRDHLTAIVERLTL